MCVLSLIAEVERAAEAITAVGAGKVIERVETNEDTIVYSGCTHEEFVSLMLCDILHPVPN